MQNILVSFLILISSISAYSVENSKQTDTGCNSEDSLEYFWDEEKKECKTKLKISEKIFVTNEKGVYIIKHENGDKVYATWKKNYIESSYKEHFISCPDNNVGCFVKDLDNKTALLTITGLNSSDSTARYFTALEGYDQYINDNTRFSFKFQVFKCGDSVTSRFVVKDNKDNKEQVKFALTSDSFKTVATSINNKVKCEKLNQKTSSSSDAQTRSSTSATSPPNLK